MFAGKRPTVLFLHIPKCAGLSLTTTLRAVYPADCTHFVIGPDYAATIEALRLKSESGKRKLQLITGHFPFGLHVDLPQPTTYVTMLRHPIERFLSHYYYVLSQPSHYLHDQVKGRNLSLADYAEANLSEELDNGQTRFLAGNWDPAIRATEKRCGRDDLLLAKKNLEEHFAAVGIVERYRESLQLFEASLGWPCLRESQVNVTPSRKPRSDLRPEVARSVESANRYDLELYEFACELFERQCREQRRTLRQRQFAHGARRLFDGSRALAGRVWREIRAPWKSSS